MVWSPERGRNFTFVKIYTDEGPTGLGEADITWKEDAIRGLINSWTPHLIGMDSSHPIGISVGNLHSIPAVPHLILDGAAFEEQRHRSVPLTQSSNGSNVYTRQVARTVRNRKWGKARNVRQRNRLYRKSGTTIQFSVHEESAP